MRFADVQKASPLPKATLSRLLHQLQAEGMLTFEARTQRYTLGLRLIRLAHGAWESASLVEVARPVIDRLAHKFGTTVHLACLDNAQVLYLDKRIPRPTISMFSAPGRIGPAYCTGVGKAMLAYLPEDRRRAGRCGPGFRPVHREDADLAERARGRARGHPQARLVAGRRGARGTVICVALPILGRTEPSSGPCPSRPPPM